MSLKIHIIIAVIILAGLGYVLNLVRKRKMELKYSLSWIVAGVMILIFDCIPGFMVLIADFVGIASPVNMIFFLGFCFTLVIVLTLSVALSINSSSVKRLTQKTAMLEKEIDALKNEKRDNV